MAPIVAYSPVISDARGSAGGSTFTRCMAGAVLKAKTQHNYTITPRRQLAQATLALIASYWKETLTNTQRTSWNTRAAATLFTNRLGQMHPISGHALFVRTNTLMSMAGLPIVATAPAQALLSLPPLYISWVAPGASPRLQTFDPLRPPASCYVAYSSSPWTVTLPKSPRNMQPYLGYTTLTANTALDTLIATSDSPPTGYFAWYRFRAFTATGLIAPAFFKPVQRT